MTVGEAPAQTSIRAALNPLFATFDVAGYLLMRFGIGSATMLRCVLIDRLNQRARTIQAPHRVKPAKGLIDTLQDGAEGIALGREEAQTSGRTLFPAPLDSDNTPCCQPK